MIWNPDAEISDFGLPHRANVAAIPREELLPIVAAMAGEPVAAFSLREEHRQKVAKGFYGYKPIVTFDWTAASGRTGSTVACVKWGPAESVHQRFLAAHGFPVCRLYGALPRPMEKADRREILFYEYLHPVGMDDEDAAQRRRFLALRAWLNALPLTDIHRAAVLALQRRQDLEPLDVLRERIRDVWQHIRAAALDGRLVADLARVFADASDLSERVADLAVRVESDCRAMPQALSIVELCPGTRPATGEWVCFDLHGARIAPRFFDVRHVFGQPEGVHDGWGRAWHPRRALAEHYARELASRGGPRVGIDDLLRECRTLWLRHAVEQGWWLDRALAGETGCRDDLASVAAYLADPQVQERSSVAT